LKKERGETPLFFVVRLAPFERFTEKSQDSIADWITTHHVSI